MLALWAEMNVIVADEFRDGNVGANSRLLPVAQAAFEALSETVAERYFRGDSACYEQELMRWLRNPKRENGPEGFIGFGISASMSESLRERIRMLPETLWQPYWPTPEVPVRGPPRCPVHADKSLSIAVPSIQQFQRLWCEKRAGG